MSSFSRAASSTLRRRLALAAGAAVAGGAGLIAALERETVKASELNLHPPELPWSHNGLFGQYDAFSIRRGWQVYKQVCVACHSLEVIAYYQMVNVFLTLEEAKAEAAEAMVWDGPGDDGKMFQRPGKVADRVPKPYENTVAAALANNGAVPPDLSLITLARHGGLDYVFWLLTSYAEEPPAGIRLGPGQAYNPYFPGGVIGMPRQLFDEGVEYDDGTPATTSQQAKDVCTFLAWTADPHLDLRKRTGFKGFCMTALFMLFWVPHWRTSAQGHHMAKIAFRVVPGREPGKRSLSSVFDASPKAGPEHQLAQGRPVTVDEITRNTEHLYKSYAPRYDWKESEFWAKWRRFVWHNNFDHRQFGMLVDDLKCPDNDPVVYEAIARLPPWEADARDRRDIRAQMLSVANEWLPKEQWTRYEDETWYLQPYLDQVEAEIAERAQADLRWQPNFLRRFIMDAQMGKGTPKPA